MKETCIYEPKKAHGRQGLEEIRSYVNGKKTGEVPSEAVISAAAALALSGNIESQTIFLQQPKSLALDGASAEEFGFARTTLSRLKEAHCLP